MERAEALRPGFVSAILMAVAVSACVGDQDVDNPLPKGWRNIAFARCCQIGLPPGFSETAKPPGVTDQTFMTVGDGSAEITFEYRPQVGFPEGPLGQTGWSRSTMVVDGHRADIVRYDARDAFAGGQTLRMRVALQDEPTLQSPPSPARGMELGATGHCRDASSCQTIEQIFQLIDLPASRH